MYPPLPPPTNPSILPRTFKEFYNLVCMFHGISDGLQVFSKTVSLFDSVDLENELKKIDLITGPSWGGGVCRGSAKSPSLTFFLKPSLMGNSIKVGGWGQH